MSTLTFRDFSFRACHHLGGYSEAASHTHWHSYSLRIWFRGPQDQDDLVAKVERTLNSYHGADLTKLMPEIQTTDENLAYEILRSLIMAGCVKVLLVNDGCRGAEATL